MLLSAKQYKVGQYHYVAPNQKSLYFRILNTTPQATLLGLWRVILIGKEPVLKIGDTEMYWEFESLTRRQIKN